MKTLYVIRHAKSSWEDFSLSDHDRPLLPKGEKRTKRISEFLKRKNVKPGLLLSSSAVRAYETARIIASDIGYPEDKIMKTENLYHASSDEIFDELFALPDELDSVMIFGHNPTFTYFVNRFIRPGIDNLPTTGTVSVTFDCDFWNDIPGSDFHVNFVVFPSMLK